jgi:hypothetical protein
MITVKLYQYIIRTPEDIYVESTYTSIDLAVGANSLVLGERGIIVSRNIKFINIEELENE